MRIKVSRENLISGIQTVQNIVSSRSTLPILSNILIEAKTDILKLNTTDLDVGISCEIPVNVYEDGGITIPAKRFNDIIRELPAGDITITGKKNNQIDIEGENCRFKLMGLPREEFPKFPEFKDSEIIHLEQSVFKEMLQLTSFAVSHEETRYILSGVLIQIKEDNVRMVATDGRRLAKIDKKVVGHPPREAAKQYSDGIEVIIPHKAIVEISRNLKETGQVSLIPGTNQILFNIDSVLIATRIIEGEFPNYEQVIPLEVSPKIKVKPQDLLASIRRANLLATPDFQAIKFEVFPNKLVVSKSTPDVGESREELPIEYGGPELMVGFNPQFFIDLLKNINQEIIELELVGPDKPAVIRLPDYLYLALPMRI